MNIRDMIHIYKVVLVGDSSVGKTTLAYWLLRNRKSNEHTPTIGAAFMVKDMRLSVKNIIGKDSEKFGTVVPRFSEFNNSEVNVKLNIWDTAGQERFNAITRMYYRNTNGCVFVFDVTNRKSFDNLNYWIKDYRDNNSGADGIIIIIANKCDNPANKWCVDQKELESFANSNKCRYFLTDCINGTNIEQAFTTLASEMYMQKMLSQNNIIDNASENNIITDLAERTKKLFNYEKCKCGS